MQRLLDKSMRQRRNAKVLTPPWYLGIRNISNFCLTNCIRQVILNWNQTHSSLQVFFNAKLFPKECMMENASQKCSLVATNKNSTRLSLLDVNSVGNKTSLHYPIQPYPLQHRASLYGALPSGKYKKIIAYYHQIHSPNDDIKRMIYPTGNTGLVFSCDPYKPLAYLVGSPTFPREAEYATSRSIYFVIFFWPGTAFAFHKLPAKELTDRSLSLGELLPAESERITMRMVAANTFQERIRIFENFMEGCMPLLQEIPNNLLSIIATTCRNFDYLTRKEAEDRTCYTERHIRRLFEKYIGISPILFKRIMRYQKTLRALNVDPKQDLSNLAVEQGYYDQPHFIKEFKRFQGVTPTEFIRSLNKKTVNLSPHTI